jgi:NAD(P)-dependent dehydrogenase (short-subunit alcohol dehydrogenase family)
MPLFEVIELVISFMKLNVHQSWMLGVGLSLLLSGVVGWSTSSLVTSTTTSSSKPSKTVLYGSAPSRRMFLATSVAGASLAGLSQTSWASSMPTASSLVAPNNALQGKVMVITGGTTGLGLESAKALAQGGATVVLTARTSAKGSKAVQTVQDYLRSNGIDNDKVYSVQLDLDDLDNVKSFPDRFQQAMGNDAKIDVLLNNAGVMAIPDRQLTKDGYERTFQSNHLGHFVLTSKLVPFLNKDARVINVSSAAYLFAGTGLDLDNLNGEKSYGAWSSYGQSKLENILFTQELQRRADAAGLSLTTTALHPGGVNTDLGRNMVGGDDAWFARKEKGPNSAIEKALDFAVKKFTRTPDEGAATQVYLAISPTIEKASFYSDLKVQSLPSFAKDETVAKMLWEKSEQLSGVNFNL